MFSRCETVWVTEVIENKEKAIKKQFNAQKVVEIVDNFEAHYYFLTDLFFRFVVCR